MPRLTIHTSTFNRAYILGQAYQSLCKQTCKDFEWVITDDGSTDDTENLVASWQANDNGFTIIYNKLEHVGIPRALNSGVSKASTEWFMMLDSDDYILPNTVESVLPWLDEINDNPSFAGIGFARGHQDGTFMKDQSPLIDSRTGYVDASHTERHMFNLDMDMCEVHRVSLLKQFPFQYWETESYAPEQLNFYELALAGYKLRWRDNKLYICEYLSDGQTRNNRLVARNPMGFAMMYNQNLKVFHKFSHNFNDALQLIALCYYAKHLSYLNESNNKMLTCLCFLPGILLGVRRKMQFRKLLSSDHE